MTFWEYWENRNSIYIRDEEFEEYARNIYNILIENLKI